MDLVLFLAGIVVGAMNAVAGGGSLIAFPVLLATGLPPLAANVTHYATVLPGAISAAYGYRKFIRRLSKQYLLLLIPCVLGAAIGATLLLRTPAEQFQNVVPALVIFAVVLFAFQPLLHFHLHRHIRGLSKGLQPLVLIAIALFPVAIYGGYFGAGFGFIMLAFLGLTRLHDINKMNGLKNLAGGIICVVSLAFLWHTNLIDWHTGLVMAAGGMVGGYYGAVLTQRIPSHLVRMIIIAIGAGTAIYIGIQSY